MFKFIMNLKCLLMPDFVGNPKNIVISSETEDVTHVRPLGSFSQDKSLKCASLNLLSLRTLLSWRNICPVGPVRICKSANLELMV